MLDINRQLTTSDANSSQTLGLSYSPFFVPCLYVLDVSQEADQLGSVFSSLFVVTGSGKNRIHRHWAILGLTIDGGVVLKYTQDTAPNPPILLADCGRI
jgi:hypothetical protein